MTVLPHRYPMLLIDRILGSSPTIRDRLQELHDERAIFQGHFPGFPLMPGVIMIEALAQLGGTIILRPDDFAGAAPCSPESTR